MHSNLDSLQSANTYVGRYAFRIVVAVGGAEAQRLTRVRAAREAPKSVRLAFQTVGTGGQGYCFEECQGLEAHPQGL